MPTPRLPLLHVYCHTFKSQHGQKRGFSILKDFGLDTVTKRNIEAYGKRHRNVHKASHGRLTSKAKENGIARETTEIDSAKRQKTSTEQGRVFRKYVPKAIRKYLSKSSVTEIQLSADSKFPNPVGQDQKPGQVPHFEQSNGTPLETENIRDFRQHTQRQIDNTVSSVLPDGLQRKPPPDAKLSLFEELFPDEAKRPIAEEPSAERKKRELPELVLREIEVNVDNDFEDGYVKPRQSQHRTTETASRDASKQWNPAILVLEVASPSLIESDFRRIAPKGEHISDWVGPGDIFMGRSDGDGYKRSIFRR